MVTQDIFKLAMDNINKISIAAMNRAAKDTLTALKKQITSKYNIKNKDLTAKMTLYKASKNRDYASIAVKHEPICLIYFDSRQTKRGVTYAIEKGQRKLWQSAFFVNISKGGEESRVQVFERYGPKVLMTKGRYKGHLRQRIRKLVGPSIAQLFMGKKWQTMNDFILPEFKARYEKEFQRLKELLFKDRPSVGE